MAVRVLLAVFACLPLGQAAPQGGAPLLRGSAVAAPRGSGSVEGVVSLGASDLPSCQCALGGPCECSGSSDLGAETQLQEAELRGMASSLAEWWASHVAGNISCACLDDTCGCDEAEAEADGGASDLDGHTSALAHYWARLQGAEASEGTSEDAAVEPSEHALGEWSAAVSSLVRAPVRRVRRRVVRRTVRRSTVVVRRGCVCGVTACACGSAGAVAVR